MVTILWLIKRVYYSTQAVYFASTTFRNIPVGIFFNKQDKPFVVHLLEPVMKQCFTGELHNFVKKLLKKKMLIKSSWKKY